MASDLPDPLFSPGAPIPSLMSSSGEPQGGFDFWRLYAALVKRLWLVGVIFVVTVTAVAFWTFRQVRIYRAEASIVIDLTPPQVLKNVPEVVDLGSGSFWSTKEYFETQYKIMRSRAVSEKVVQRLALDRDYDFLHLPPNLDPAQKARVLKAIDPVQMVIDRIQVVPLRDSRVVNIGIEDTNPQRATDLANAVAEEYIEQNVDRKLMQTHGASAWLAQQLVGMRKKLEDSERALYQFKKDHDVLSTSLEARQNIVSDRLLQVNNALTKTALLLTELSARQEALQRVLAEAKEGEFQAESFKPVADNPRVSALKIEYFHLKGERAQLAERYKDDFPKIKTIDERLKQLRGEIEHEIQLVLRSANEEYRQALDVERKQRAMLDGAKKEALAVNSLEVEFDPLKRDKDSVQNQYELMMKRQKEVDVAGLLRTNNIRMLDPALVPKAPSRPNRAQNIATAALVGLLLGIAFVIGLEFLDTTVKSQDDVENVLGLPLLGILPSIPNIAGDAAQRDNIAQRDLYVSANPKSSISECARAIRTSLLFSSPDRPFKVLLVASCGPREGKSTCAVSIGITMAQSGNRVLLVDGDLRRPRLHRTFSAPSQSGLSTLILGEAGPDEAIKSTGVERLFLLPAGPVPPNPAELLQSARYREVLNELAPRFDRIIIDSPPVGVVTDALVMSAQADGVVVVLRAGVTPKKAAARGRRTLLDVKAHVYGAVLNDVDLGSRVGQYYYYYRYGYYPSDKYPGTTGGGEAKPKREATA